jgi:hypothetical protein
VDLSTRIMDAPTGIDRLFAIGIGVPPRAAAECAWTATFADDDPKFEITKVLIFQTVPDAEALFATENADVLDKVRLVVFPTMFATFTIFGAAINYPPKSIAIAMDFPVVATGALF